MAAQSTEDRLQSALTHLKRGEPERAKYELIECVAKAPRNADAWFLLGTIALTSNRLSDAESFFERAIDLSPNNAVYYTNLGEVYRRLQDFDRAINRLERATLLNPKLAAAHFNLGAALRAAGRTREGLIAMQRAVAIRPDIDEKAQLAEALSDDGQHDEAVKYARRALAKRPSAAAHVALGNALFAEGKYDEAIIQHARAIELEPHNVLAHVGNGHALCEAGRIAEGLGSLRDAAKLDPENPISHIYLAEYLAWYGRIEEAVASARQAAILSREPLVQSSLIFTLLHDPSSDDATVRSETLTWQRRYEEPVVCEQQKLTNNRSRDRRIRVGYLSAGFRNMVDSHFTIPLLANHDREKFEVYGYCCVKQPDAITEKNRSYTDVWRDVARMSHAEMAGLIRSDAIDILVDLAMHTQSHLPVFARKPAPVQICWLPYPGTTGLKAMDFRITDPYLDPPEAVSDQYSEQSLWLPDSFWCYDPLTSLPAVNALPALRNGYVTFGSFNRFTKVNQQVLELWARLMAAVRGSRLVLYVPQGVPSEQVYAAFDAAGVLRERISISRGAARKDYLAGYHHVDVALDPFPYNGGTTSLDALWMGVPVITLAGRTAVGRMGVSIASNLGLREFVAESPDRYVDIALTLARDLERLAVLRAELRSRMEQSPLMDAPRFARSMEAAYRMAWETWCTEA